MTTDKKVKMLEKFGSHANVIKFNYTRDEAAFSLGVSVRIIDYLIERGDLDTRRIGKKVLVPREALRRYAAADHPEPAAGARVG